MTSDKGTSAIRHSTAPWLSIPSAAKALEFYQSAFGAVQTYRHNDPSGGIVVRLSVSGADFWLSQDGPDHPANSEPLGGGLIRMILTVPNPDEVFASALKAGATQIFAVAEGHGWRLGRLADPFGLHWEIGLPLE